MTLTVRRLPTRFYPDSRRVIARFFMPGGEGRVKHVIGRILSLSKEEVHRAFHQVLVNFSERHRSVSTIFYKHFDEVKPYIKQHFDLEPDDFHEELKLLIGSYYSMEYSIEAAAFFNPSIIEDPNQDDLEEGQKRVILSFRATGEGHVSSIVFRSGVLQKDSTLTIKPISRNVDIPVAVERHVYHKKQFLERINQLEQEHKQSDNIEKAHSFASMKEEIMGQLKEEFIYGELRRAIEACKRKDNLTVAESAAIDAITWLARSHYDFSFSYDTSISERVIFPVSYTESNGIEDARFVRFVDDDGSVKYYAAYTAYSGYSILPKLLETSDFYSFKVGAINGRYAEDKGMALFPRKINGRYAMLSRVDGFNNYIMFSDQINQWDECKKIQEADQTWEFSQIGNCGSPIETDRGWLLITHGVGPMRRYCLGAALLDLEDPTKVIARLKEPLLTPNDDEREGYVPNVVYSCGSMIHNDCLVVPYAMSDWASSVCTIPLRDIFNAFTYVRK
jgi:predicted GH43/DUF377 family glycosyl hydrolase